MKISFTFAVIIVALAALFILKQREKNKTFGAGVEELKTTTVEKNISTNPEANIIPQRTRSETAREKSITEFASKFAAFAKKLEKALDADGGSDAEMQKEQKAIIGKLSNLSPTSLKSLVKALSADTSLKNETKRDLIMMSILQRSSEHPQTALALIGEANRSLDLVKNKRDMLPLVIAQYASKDLAGAATWIIENENWLNESAQEIKIQLVDTATQKNFSSALTMIDSLDLSETDRGSIIKGLSVSNVLKYPEQWLDWMGAQETKTEATEQAIKRIIRVWTKRNFVGAGEWVQNQEAGPTRNNAVKTYAETLAPHEPAAAADWAVTLPPSDERTQLLQTIHNSLKGQDPTAAAALAEKYQLNLD